MALDDFLTDQPDPTDDTPAIVVTVDEVAFDKLKAAQTVLAPTGDESIFDVIWRLTGLNRDDWEIVPGTFGHSIWEQSARSKKGDRDHIVLRSYRGKFRKRESKESFKRDLLDGLRKRTVTERRAKGRALRHTPGTGLGPSVALTPLFSDWQYGKGAIRPQDVEALGSTGPEQTHARVLRAVEGCKALVKDARRRGLNVDRLAAGFLGDAVENVAGSYASQTHDVRLNFKSQIKGAIDLAAYALEELLPIFDEPGDVFGVICNHGQMSRGQGKSNVTDDSDNAQNLMLEILRDHIVGPRWPGLRWHIPGEEMIVTLDVAGVRIAAAHGHTIRGSEDAWLLKQTASLAALRNEPQPRVWLTGHRHSQDYLDLGAIVRIQAATADGGSKFFTDGSAIYSTPGTTVTLIGTHDERGCSDPVLL